MTHRTQLYLDQARYAYVVSLAKSTKTSIAEVIRKAIDAYRLKEMPARPKDDALYRLIGMAQGDGARIAETYEDYLYGKPSQ